MVASIISTNVFKLNNEIGTTFASSMFSRKFHFMQEPHGSIGYKP